MKDENGMPKGYVPMSIPYVSNQPHVKQTIIGQMNTATREVVSSTVIYAATVINGVETPLDPDRSENARWFESKTNKKDLP